jgi:hypothetical protein
VDESSASVVSPFVAGQNTGPLASRVADAGRITYWIPGPADSESGQTDGQGKADCFFRCEAFAGVTLNSVFITPTKSVYNTYKADK